MSPDPERLRKLAELVRILADHADHARAMVLAESEGVHPAEGGVTLQAVASNLESHGRSIRLLSRRLLVLAGAEGKNEARDVMPRVNGVPFRCGCGYNVFRWVATEQGSRLRCNSCAALYVTEENTNDAT
jgi:hypothetical protein